MLVPAVVDVIAEPIASKLKPSIEPCRTTEKADTVPVVETLSVRLP